MNFPEFGTKFYHRLVTDGYLAVLVEFEAPLENRVRLILETHGGEHIERPERQTL